MEGGELLYNEVILFSLFLVQSSLFAWAFVPRLVSCHFPSRVLVWDSRVLHVVLAALVQDLNSPLGISNEFYLLFEGVALLVLVLGFSLKPVYVGFVLVEYFLLHHVVHLDGSLCLLELNRQVLVLFLQIFWVPVVDCARNKHWRLGYVVSAWPHQDLRVLHVPILISHFRVISIIWIWIISIILIVFIIMPIGFDLLLKLDELVF